MKGGKVIYVAIIGAIFFYLIFAMMRFGDGNADRQEESVRRIIDKALIQCYALEGSYPTELEAVEQYGVILDNKNFVFYYEWYGRNVKPILYVFKR
jgi:hypothetical protein